MNFRIKTICIKSKVYASEGLIEMDGKNLSECGITIHQQVGRKIRVEVVSIDKKDQSTLQVSALDQICT